MTSCIKGKGDVVNTTFTVEDFSGITNNISADVYITRSETPAVVISAQSNITENITLDVTDGMLTIDFKRKNVRHYKPITIAVSTPQLTQIVLNGSGNIYTTSTFDSCGTASVTINGSGNINTNFNSSIKTFSTINGSGDISLSGSSPNHDIVINGSGNIHAFPFYTQNSNIRIIGSGSCQVNAQNTLNVFISGSGDVYYTGHPNITMNISGSGSVNDAN